MSDIFFNGLGWATPKSSVFVVKNDKRMLLPMTTHARLLSPTGYNWGYGGSGPRALAHSVLSYVIGIHFADKLFEQFEQDIIKKLPMDTNWMMPKDGILFYLYTRTNAPSAGIIVGENLSMVNGMLAGRDIKVTNIGITCPFSTTCPTIARFYQE
jgi:hypothetical protein